MHVLISSKLKFIAFNLVLLVFCFVVGRFKCVDDGNMVLRAREKKTRTRNGNLPFIFVRWIRCHTKSVVSIYTKVKSIWFLKTQFSRFAIKNQFRWKKWDPSSKTIVCVCETVLASASYYHNVYGFCFYYFCLAVACLIQVSISRQEKNNLIFKKKKAGERCVYFSFHFVMNRH